MRIFKRLMVIMALALAPVFAAYADECTTTLYLHTKAGEKIGFRFADKPIITFNPAKALIINSDALEVATRVSFSKVDKITFDDASGITDIEADASGIITPGLGNIITLSGFGEGTLVTVSNLNGQIMETLRLTGEGETQLSLDAYGKGVYIVTAGDVVCKIALK